MPVSAVRVRLLDVPVALFAATDRHTGDLLREIALVVAARPDAESGRVFGDLLARADAYVHGPGAVHQRVAAAVFAAERTASEVVDVTVEADAAAAEAALAWDDLQRQFDVLSREDQVLTLPADPEVVAFRTWYVREVVEQVRTGRAPISWLPERALVG